MLMQSDFVPVIYSLSGKGMKSCDFDEDQLGKIQAIFLHFRSLAFLVSMFYQVFGFFSFEVSVLLFPSCLIVSLSFLILEISKAII